MDDLPASRRFYAGGDNSIRGWGYDALGPNDPVNDQTVGGRYLAVGSLELEREIVGPWSVAVFTDFGNAFDPEYQKQWEQSVGLGVRWRSPIGQVRLDLAFALTKDAGGTSATDCRRPGCTSSSGPTYERHPRAPGRGPLRTPSRRSRPGLRRSSPSSRPRRRGARAGAPGAGSAPARGGLLLVLLLVVVLAGLVLGTQTGLRTALAVAEDLAPGVIRVGLAEGRVLGRLHLRDLELHLPGLDLTLGDLDLDWSPLTALAGTLKVRRLVARDIDLILTQQEGSRSP